MKKYFLLILLLSIILSGYAQKIETDIFNDLRYESYNKRYVAALKKDIFGNLIFSDNYKNKITYKKQYLDLKYGDELDDSDKKADFFIDMIFHYEKFQKYEATFSVDIFGKVIIEDNNGTKIELGTDIFGNPTYKEYSKGNTISIDKDLSGVLNYKSNNNKATLKEDIFNKWIYNDSKGNKLELSTDTWNTLLERYGSSENIFQFFIDEFLLD